MPDTLSLNSSTSAEAIRNYFISAGPDARIGVRQGTDDGSVELYRRDKLTGVSILVDIVTNAFARRDNYTKAREFIASAAKDGEWLKNAKGAKDALSNILQNHRENFYAAEFIVLNDQIVSQERAIRGLETARTNSKATRQDWNVLSPALSNADPKKVAIAICGQSASEERKAERAEEFVEFRKFMQWRLEGIKTPVSIDFVSVVKFEATLLTALEDTDRRPELDVLFQSSDNCSTLYSLLENTIFPGRPEVKALYADVVKDRKFKEAKDYISDKLDLLKREDPRAVADWIGKVLEQKNDRELKKSLEQKKGLEQQEEPVSPEKLAKLESGFRSLYRYFDDMKSRGACDAQLDFEAILTLKESFDKVVHFLETEGADPPKNTALKAGTHFVRPPLAALLDIELPQTSGPSIEEFI